MFHERISLNSVLLLLLVNFVSGFRVEMMYSSDRLVILAKGFLEMPNLHMLIKQKSPSLPRNLALRTFGKLLILFSTKVNLPYLL